MNKLTLMRAVRAKCLDCMAYQPKEIRLCPARDCSLWAYRMGHKPRVGSEEENVLSRHSPCFRQI